MTVPPTGQPGVGVRFDWGPAGAAELSRVCAVLVLVDVLCFATAIDVAVGRGIRVHPFPWEPQAAEYAARIGAVAAVSRDRVGPGHPWTVSPAALCFAPVVADLVLPDSHGAAICAAAESTGVPVVAACLRNAAAVGRWLLAQGYGTVKAPVGVIAAGERWSDGTLRPCVADQVGAAAVCDALSTASGGLSVEAAVVLATLSGVPDVSAAVRGSVTGRELAAAGLTEDVEIAVGTRSTTVPVLRHDAFSAAA